MSPIERALFRANMALLLFVLLPIFLLLLGVAFFPEIVCAGEVICHD